MSSKTSNDAIFGIYDEVSRLDLPCVLWRDYNGFYAPLVSMFWSTSSLILVSRHPFNCIEEIISVYCPQCLTRHTDDDRIVQSRCTTCFECPICYGVQILTSKQLNDDRSFLCNSCGWKGKDETTMITDDSAIHTVTATKAATDAFQQLMNQKLYSESSSSSDGKISRQENADCRSHAEVIHRWQLADLDASLASKALSNCAIEPTKLVVDAKTAELSTTKTSALLDVVTYRMQFPELDSSLLSCLKPRRMKLRSKRLIRCRKDVEDGKMNILLQPNKAPLDGDTYSVTSRGKSSFFVKDSSAVHELPNVVITSSLDASCGVDLQKNESTMIEITITNPKVTRVRIRISNDMSYESSSSSSSSSSPSSSSISASSSSHIGTAAFNERNVLLLHSRGSSEGSDDVVVAEFTLGGYEDELLRDNSDDDSPGTNSASSSGPHNPSVNEQERRVNSSSWVVSHNVAVLSLCVKCRDGLGSNTTNISSVSEPGPLIGVLPLLMSIEDLDSTTKPTPRDFQVLIAFPLSVN